jgi:hypothetical protein
MKLYFLGRIIKKNGIFGSVDKPKIVTCAVFTPNGDLLTGDSNGSVVGWERKSNNSNFCITNVHKGQYQIQIIYEKCVLVRDFDISRMNKNKNF